MRLVHDVQRRLPLFGLRASIDELAPETLSSLKDYVCKLVNGRELERVGGFWVPRLLGMQGVVVWRLRLDSKVPRLRAFGFSFRICQTSSNLLYLI